MNEDNDIDPDELLRVVNEMDIGPVAPTEADIQEMAEGAPQVAHEVSGELLPLGGASNDFDAVKENLKTIINNGTGSMRALLMLANASDHPRAYEALTGLITALADANMKLLEVHERRANLDLLEAKKNNGGAAVVNQNLFVGTSEEMNKVISDMIAKQNAGT